MKLLAIVVLLAATACASRLPDLPANASIGAGTTLPSPQSRANEAPPQIQAMHFNTLDVARGNSWHGEFSTTTNVASLEVRTNLFSIDVPRTDFGRFAFTLNLLDVPPIFIRPYRLRVIARNSAGQEAEEDLPLQIR